MGKRCIACALLALLLAGCAAPAQQPELPAETAEAADESLLLVGVWRNDGQYTEGRDFVETLTIEADGSCTIHLDYQGENYQTLEGVYVAADGMLYTTLHSASETVQRDFQYSVTDDTLLLKTESKEVYYTRIG